jgi:serine/threonine-protein kinase
VTDLLRASLQASLGAAYTLEHELGGGGMSRVFIADEARFGRKVVVKVLSPELAGGLSAERFEREVRLAATLQEPHIVPVLAAGATADGLPYYTMPFVSGESLRDRLRRGPLDVDEALRVLRDVATALEHAHARGVVHRDVKPENVLLSGRTAVVTDFGIAKAIGAARTGGVAMAGSEAGSMALTVAGTSVGTPAYMAPEQALGGDVDARADVYAWGMLAYELFAGVHPFAGKATAQRLLAAQVAEAPPPLASRARGVRPAVAALVMRCLAKDPVDRPSSAGEILRALDVVDGRGVSGVWTRRSGRAPAVAGIIATAALVAAAWWRARDTVPNAAPVAVDDRSIAVLPFENLGSASDAYFADGVSDAVRGKLVALPNLTVIARASSAQYRDSGARPDRIARELGVRYLLTGTVRWTHATNGTSRVQVSPELVEVAAGKPPAVRWQQPFDAALTDVFRVQANIATEVAEALDLALGSGELGRIAERPTRSLDAYDAYLRAEDLTQGLAVTDVATLRRVVPLYERAVALDSTFVGAWARLAHAYVSLYSNAGAAPDLAAAARRAAERAVALAPTDARALAALGVYFDEVEGDFSRALEVFARADRLAPNDVEVLYFQADAEAAAGRQASAVDHALRAVRLDPRSGRALRVAADRLVEVRRLREADSLYRRAQVLAPRSQTALLGRVIVRLAEGDLAGARAVARDSATQMTPAEIAATLGKFSDLYWVLDDEQQRILLRLRPDAFDSDTAAWALAVAETYASRGDATRARVYADSARRGYETRTRASPNDAEERALLGVSLAYLGRHRDARREGERAAALAPLLRDLATGPYVQHQLVRIHLLAGANDEAIAQLEPLLNVPYLLTPAWLRIDPTFAPLRGDQRFDRLVHVTR